MHSKEVRILVVDDYEIVRTLMQVTLVDLGYSWVDMADDGDRALEMLEDAYASGEPYSLVFLDWGMPKLHGMEFLRICRASVNFKHLPIVVVTGETQQESMVDAFRTGATDYVVKPIFSEEIKNKIVKIVANSQKQKSG